MDESMTSIDDIREGNRKLAARVLDLARNEGLTIGTAESCTGGLCAATLTEVPGSSDVVRGGIVSYWVEVKETVLGVSPDTIEDPGVVSEQCAREMAQGARSCLSCDLAVSTTGIAGPGGAEPGKPVGTVCFGLSTPEGRESWTTCRGTTRQEIRYLAVRSALEKLESALLKRCRS
ncbi:MAG: CinA family protein [Coriobacteriales bacterium]|jgi:PncC family amidohydrolase